MIFLSTSQKLLICWTFKFYVVTNIGFRYEERIQKLILLKNRLIKKGYT